MIRKRFLNHPDSSPQIAVRRKQHAIAVVHRMLAVAREVQGRVEIDRARKRIRFLPDPEFLWGQRYTQSQYDLVSGTPDEIEAIGGDELLYDLEHYIYHSGYGPTNETLGKYMRDLFGMEEGEAIQNADENATEYPYDSRGFRFVKFKVGAKTLNAIRFSEIKKAT